MATEVGPEAQADELTRRRFLGVVAAPVLTVAIGGPLLKPSSAGAAIPSPPQLADTYDLGDLYSTSCKPTEDMLVLELGEDGVARLQLPRMEVGQGITTALAMVVAEEMELPLAQVEVLLSDARPELVWNQLTGGSTTIRSTYLPVRRAAAVARERLRQAASLRFNVSLADIELRAGVAYGPGGASATYASLTSAAAALSVAHTQVQMKPSSAFTLVGTPTNRVDARAIVTGQKQFTLDLDVPGALPTVVRRPPTLLGSPQAILNAAQVRAMPGVVDIALVPTGVAVAAETFGQALAAKDALQVTWNPGTIDGKSNEDIANALRAAMLPFAPALLVKTLDAEFDFAPVAHAPMETNTAVADVRPDRAEIWSGLKIPIVTLQNIAREAGLPQSRVVVHVIPSGGSFGRRLYHDGALEAARISKAMGRPVKLMWTRADDIRHGRVRGATHHKVRLTYALGQVLSYEHRMASTKTDWSHGFGEIITALAAAGPGNFGYAQTIFNMTVACPYNFGVVTELLNEPEAPLLSTSAWRSVYSPMVRGVEELLVDEMAALLRKDPLAFRRSVLKDAKQRAVLDAVASAGRWGRAMPAGHAQGLGFHQEYRSMTACLVELDGTDPNDPRVTKAVIAADVGRPINPRGLEGQLLGGLTDAISTVLKAGLHFDDGLPLESSYSDFRYARQSDSPIETELIVLPANRELPGGAGELGVAAAAGAVANAYARATGRKPRKFPINFDVDFEPAPR